MSLLTHIYYYLNIFPPNVIKKKKDSIFLIFMWLFRKQAVTSILKQKFHDHVFSVPKSKR